MKRFLPQILAGMVVFVMVMSISSIANAKTSDKVRICHRTNDAQDPYTNPSVNESAVDGLGANDHTHHTGPIATSVSVAETLKSNHIKWGDIIPPHPGNSLNWTTEGQAIWENGCVVPGEISPSPSPSSSTTPTPTPSCSVTPTPTPTPSECIDDEECPTPTPTPSGCIGEECPTPTPSETFHSSHGTKVKASPQVLGTSTAQPLPVTGADINYDWIYYFLLIGSLMTTYYLKVRGWKSLRA